MFQNQLIGLHFLVNKVLFQFLYIIGLSMIFPCLSILEYLLLELNVYLNVYNTIPISLYKKLNYDISLQILYLNIQRQNKMFLYKA